RLRAIAPRSDFHGERSERDARLFSSREFPPCYNETRQATSGEARIGQSIKKQLAELRELDRDLKVFGARAHRYEWSVVDAIAGENLEWLLGVTLPAEYREFLLDVGAGAGPYYGLWQPKQVFSELRSFAVEWEIEMRKPIRPAGEFPLTANDLREIEAKTAA